MFSLLISRIRIAFFTPCIILNQGTHLIKDKSGLLISGKQQIGIDNMKIKNPIFIKDYTSRKIKKLCSSV